MKVYNNEISQTIILSVSSSGGLWYLPYGQRVSLRSTNLKPRLVHTKNQALTSFSQVLFFS